MTPSEACLSLVRESARARASDGLAGKTCAVMVAPYPPGIPLIMPGEKFSLPVEECVNTTFLSKTPNPPCILDPSK